MKYLIHAVFLGVGLIIACSAQSSTLHETGGDINVASGQTVGDVRTVNGSIVMGANSTAKEVETTNGNITLKRGVHVHGDVETVHGNITLQKEAHVHGEISSVTGPITLHDARVDGGIETVAGNITVGRGSHVHNGIEVDEAHNGTKRAPTDPLVVIGPHAVVTGRLVFHRKVVLYLSDTARVGPIVGHDVVTKYAGPAPQAKQ